MAGEQRLLVRVAGPEGGPWEILSPGVGLWAPDAAPGDLVGPGASIGTLRTLNRRALLVLPDTLAGSVEDLPAARLVPVAYGERLLRLVPLGSAPRSVAGAAAAPAAHAAGLPPGCRALTAPTDGVFYQRPDPHSPPFVRPGSRIRTGQPIGLVEVMKTFNQILYGGAGLPEEAEVVELRCRDGVEIAAGDVLLVVR